MIESEYSNEVECERCKTKDKILEGYKLLQDISQNQNRRLLKHAKELFWFSVILSAAFIISLVFTFTANASEIPCTRAKLTWEPPTTRENGKPLPIERLDYYEIRVIDMSSGEVTLRSQDLEDYVYIFDNPKVRDVYGNPVEQYHYSTNPKDEFLKTGLQCFQIRVWDDGKNDDGTTRAPIPSAWSKEEACKEVCAWDGGIDLDIRIGVTE